MEFKDRHLSAICESATDFFAIKGTCLPENLSRDCVHGNRWCGECKFGRAATQNQKAFTSSQATDVTDSPWTQSLSCTKLAGWQSTPIFSNDLARASASHVRPTVFHKKPLPTYADSTGRTSAALSGEIEMLRFGISKRSRRLLDSRFQN